VISSIFYRCELRTLTTASSRVVTQTLPCSVRIGSKSVQSDKVYRFELSDATPPNELLMMSPTWDLAITSIRMSSTPTSLVGKVIT
jgi:hypothetical protein